MRNFLIIKRKDYENLYYVYEDKTIYAQTKEDRNLTLIGIVRLNDELTDEEILYTIQEHIVRANGFYRIEEEE